MGLVSSEDADAIAAGVAPKAVPVAALAPQEEQSPDNPYDKHAPVFPVNVNADNAEAIEPGQSQPVAALTPPPAAPAAPSVQQGQPEEAAKPSLLDTAAAAFRLNNSLSAAVDRYVVHDLTPDVPDVPGYDPWNDMKGYEDHSALFRHSTSPQQTQAIKQYVDDLRQNEQVMQRSGVAGHALAFAAGAVDPITIALMAIPGAEAFGVASRAAKVGTAVGVNVVGGELQARQLASYQGTDPNEGMGTRVGANALLAGVLGTIATRVPAKEFSAAVDRTREALSMPTIPMESTAGAAAVKGTTLEQESIARGGQTIAKTLGFISPSARIMASSPEVEARKLTQELVDVPFMLNKNKQGIATGSSVEMEVQQQQYMRHFQTIKELDAQFADYKKTGGTLTQPEFSKQVVVAMNHGDEHEIPQVKKLAAWTRAMFKQDRDALNELGVLPEGYEVLGDKSYFPRVWDQYAVANHQTQLENILRDHFTNNPKVEPVEVKDATAEPMTEFYHASPYVFSEFDHSKIGTGEGNQSFTHGIYGAQKQAVAEAYTKDLNGKPMENPQLYKGRFPSKQLAEMLDWDKPIKDQPEIMKALGLDKLDPEKMKLNGIDPGWTGQELHDNLLKGRTNVGAPIGDKAALADWLASHGIKGTKYLDRGSRTGTGESRNYVFYKNAEHELTHRNGELINPEAAPKTELGQPIYREPAEVSAAVRDTIDHIMGLTHGNADIGVGPGKPGALKGRRLDASYDQLKDYLESDYERIMTSYNHSVLPQIAMRRRFGSTDLTDQMEKISDSYRIKLAQAGEDDVKKAELSKQHSADIRDLQILRDRVLNQVGPRGNQPLWMVRSSQLIRSFNYLRMLGGQTFSAFPDVGRLVARYGLGQTALRTSQFLTGLGKGLMKEDAQKMATALDVVLHTRQSTLEGIGGELSGSDKVMRFARNQTNFFTKISLIASWDSAMRTLSSQLEQDALHSFITKGGISEFERAKLAAHGITEDDRLAMREQWLKHGANEFGLNRARTELWDDKGLAHKVEQAVQRAGSANAFFVGKGDLPGFANSELGKIAVQFKGFALSSVNRMVIPLAQGLAHGDVKAANGLAVMLGLGALTYWTKQVANGYKPDLSPHNLIPEMIQRSGVLAYLPDVYDPFANLFHLPRFSKFQDLDPLETVAGPSGGTIMHLFQAVTRMTGGEPSAQDLHSLRQVIPYQNLFYLARLVNMLEGKTADMLGLAGAPNKPAADYFNPQKDVTQPEGKPDRKHLFGIESTPNQF